MQSIIRCVLGSALLALTAAAPSPAQDNPPQWQTRTDIEARARELDRRVIDLQHDLLAARRNGDQAGSERAAADLKSVQAERVELLRALGHLR